MDTLTSMISIKSALIIIDVQKGLDDPHYGQRSNPDAEQNMKLVIQAWRNSSRPVIHIQHLSTNPASKLRPELPGCEIKEEVKPLNGERIFQKEAHSAFVGTGLSDYLHKNRFDQLVLMGLTIEHCVSSTARTAHDLGFTTYVVADATAAFGVHDYEGNYIDADTMHKASLASLHEEFVQVVSTKKLLRALQFPTLIA